MQKREKVNTQLRYFLLKHYFYTSTSAKKSRFQDYPYFFLSTDFYRQWLVETDVAYKIRLINSRLRIKKILIKKSVLPGKGVNREIAHTKRREVLKEMSTLTRLDPVVFQSRLHNYACLAYVSPFDRNSQPRV